MADLVDKLWTLVRHGRDQGMKMNDVEDAAREIERLRKGIQDFLDGNYENPRYHRGRGSGKCSHGQYWYEGCDRCDTDHFTSLLSSNNRGTE